MVGCHVVLTWRPRIGLIQPACCKALWGPLCRGALPHRACRRCRAHPQPPSLPAPLLCCSQVVLEADPREWSGPDPPQWCYVTSLDRHKLRPFLRAETTFLLFDLGTMQVHAEGGGSGGGRLCSKGTVLFCLREVRGKRRVCAAAAAA